MSQKNSTEKKEEESNSQHTYVYTYISREQIFMAER